MSNFLVCLMLLLITRAINPEFVSSRSDSLIVVLVAAFIVDLWRLIYNLTREN